MYKNLFNFLVLEEQVSICQKCPLFCYIFTCIKIGSIEQKFVQLTKIEDDYYFKYIYNYIFLMFRSNIFYFSMFSSIH